MLTCTIEFDNDIASPLSPLKFIEKYVFADNVVFVKYIKKTKTAIYEVFSGGNPALEIPKVRIMRIKLKNLEQK